MDWRIDTAEMLNVEDDELSELLSRVYVAGGFTDPHEAVTLFEPSAVRKRGLIIAARENQNSRLAGVIILVPPDSPARRLAQDNEAEIHLFGVQPEYRRQGLGRMLVEAAVDRAKQSGYTKIILWTQSAMSTAQNLYEAKGFIHVDDFQRNGRDFRVYELRLDALK